MQSQQNATLQLTANIRNMCTKQQK